MGSVSQIRLLLRRLRDSPGFTVISVFTLALAAGASFPDAARLANYAAGIVVMKHGTRTATREELAEAVRQT